MLNLVDNAVPARKQEVFQSLMSGHDLPIYVLGRNKYAERVSRVVEVQAFIDDFAECSHYLGKPVIRTTTMPCACIVVSCASYNPCTAFKRLESIGARRIIDYFTLTRLAPDVFPYVDFCADNRNDIMQNASRYEQIYSLLSDDISRDQFARIVQFRLTMDIECMRGFSARPDSQYFEHFLRVRRGDVFVDGGGFDGITSMRYATWNPNYQKIIYFEPVPNLMEISRRNLNAFRGIEFIQKGLYSRNDKVPFDVSAGDRSRISWHGQTEIEVVRLDDEVSEPVTFIKMDIEGSEYEATLGAAGHITSDVPTMAICIYHDSQHFWRIPLFILDLNDAYRLYVRHYSEGVVDTVMFFVPNDNNKHG